MTNATHSQEADETRPGSHRRAPRRRLRVEQLMILVGNEQAIRLCQQYGGLQLPSRDRLYRRLRKEAVIAERLTKGTSVATLALKYNLKPASVRKFVTEDRRQVREMKRLNERLEAARIRREAHSQP